jgi:hypothetical protein
MADGTTVHSHDPGGYKYSMVADRTLDMMVSAPVHILLICSFLYMAWVITPPRVRKQFRNSVRDLGVPLAATPLPPSISPTHRQMWSVSPTRNGDTMAMSDAESPSPTQSPPLLHRRQLQQQQQEQHSDSEAAFRLRPSADFLHDSPSVHDTSVVPTLSTEDYDAASSTVSAAAHANGTTTHDGSDGDAVSRGAPPYVTTPMKTVQRREQELPEERSEATSHTPVGLRRRIPRETRVSSDSNVTTANTTAASTVTATATTTTTTTTDVPGAGGGGDQPALRTSKGKQKLSSASTVGHAGKSQSPAASRKPSLIAAMATLAAGKAAADAASAALTAESEAEAEAQLQGLKRRHSWQLRMGKPNAPRRSGGGGGGSGVSPPAGGSSGGAGGGGLRVSSLFPQVDNTLRGRHSRARSATFELRGRDSIGLLDEEQRRPATASPWKGGGELTGGDASGAAPQNTIGRNDARGAASKAGGSGSSSTSSWDSSGAATMWELVVAASTTLAGGVLSVEVVTLVLLWRVNMLGTIADLILVADTGIAATDVALTSPERQPHWAFALQVAATVLRVWMMSGTVESPPGSVREGILPVLWFIFVHILRLMALPSVAWRWEEPLDPAGVAFAAVALLTTILGVKHVAVALWANPFDVVLLGFGVVLMALSVGLVGVLHRSVCDNKLLLVRRKSVVEESLSAHRHTLSARRACVAKAFGHAVSRNEPVSSAIAKRFRCIRPPSFSPVSS